MRKPVKILLALLGILLVIALLILLGRWAYWKNTERIFTVNDPMRNKIEEAFKKVSIFPNTCDLRTKNSGYRIGDMIKDSDSQRDKYKGKEWHIRTYPKSIVTDYFSMTSDIENVEVLVSIVKKKSEQLSAIQGCALHLRVGDVMEGSDYSVSEFLVQPRLTYPNKLWSQYVTCWRMIENCLNHHVQSRSITIFAGAHHPPMSDFPKSCQYINTIQYLLEQKGYKVSRRLGEDADEDFVLMATAPYFIQSGGGYSRLITSVRKRLGRPYCCP